MCFFEQRCKHLHCVECIVWTFLFLKSTMKRKSHKSSEGGNVSKLMKNYMGIFKKLNNPSILSFLGEMGGSWCPFPAVTVGEVGYTLDR